MVGRFCNVCNIYMSPSVWLQHEQGKKHRKHANRCCIVANLPANMSDNQLRSHLSNFPDVTCVHLDQRKKHSGVLTFKDVEAAMSFENSEPVVGNCKLKLSKPLIRPPEPQIEDVDVLGIDPPTRSRLLTEKNVEAQMHYLVERFSLTEKTIMQRLGICDMLQAVMRNFFPNCVVITYGSCANGLGMADSDLDLFVDLKVDFNPVDKMPPSGLLSVLIGNLDSYKRQTKGFSNVQFLKQVQGLNSRIVVHLVKQIISRYAKECVNLFCVANARCPIVTFVHRPTSSCCDVSVYNGLAVHNTVLVRLFQQLDPRVRPLLFTIRYWAKRMQLVDSKKNRFSSYAMTMLTVFYLQNCNPTVLPTVETLQQLSHSNATCFGWNCHFCMEQDKISKTANRDPLEILLAGFFDYYTEVDLSSNVLCLRTGKVMSQPEFTEYVTHREDLSDFKMSIFNVQDMFELNFNITRGLNATGLEQWNAAISQARSICSSGALWEKISDNHAWGLVCLLSVDPNSVVVEPKLGNGKQTEMHGKRKLDKASTKALFKGLMKKKPKLKKKNKAATAVTS